MKMCDFWQLWRKSFEVGSLNAEVGFWKSEFGSGKKEGKRLRDGKVGREAHRAEEFGSGK